MSSIQLPAEIIDLIIADESDKKILFKYSLINRNFRWVSCRRIWREVILTKRSIADLIQLLKSNKEISNSIKQFSVETSTLQRPDYDITEQMLWKLFKYLPNLSSLDLGSAELIGSPSLALQLFEDIPNLTSFSYSLDNPAGRRFFKDILYKALNLKHLTVSAWLVYPRLGQIRKCAVLESLDISNASGIKFFDSKSMFLPLSSLTSLKKFKYYGDADSSKELLHLIQLNKETLEELDLEREDRPDNENEEDEFDDDEDPDEIVEQQYFDYKDFSSALSKLTILKSLRIEPLQESPINLLQIIPSTLKTLIVTIASSQLKNFIEFPRSLPCLREVALDDPEVPFTDFLEALPLLPSTIEVIHYKELDCDELQALYSTCEKLLDFDLKVIYVVEVEYSQNWGSQTIYSLTIAEMEAVHPGYVIDEDQEIYFKKRFQKLGITLECNEWDIL